MLGGRPRTTARLARWTETSAASSRGLALHLRSVSTLQALSIVGPAPQAGKEMDTNAKISMNVR